MASKMCERFYCEQREGKYCCFDCRKKKTCEEKCQNRPNDCKLCIFPRSYYENVRQAKAENEKKAK